MSDGIDPRDRHSYRIERRDGITRAWIDDVEVAPDTVLRADDLTVRVFASVAPVPAMSDQEPDIAINGRRLSRHQALTVRVALAEFEPADQSGAEPIVEIYRSARAEVIAIMASDHALICKHALAFKNGLSVAKCSATDCYLYERHEDVDCPGCLEVMHIEAVGLAAHVAGMEWKPIVTAAGAPSATPEPHRP